MPSEEGSQSTPELSHKKGTACKAWTSETASTKQYVTADWIILSHSK